MNSSVKISSRISHQPTITILTEYVYFHNLSWPQGQSIKPGAEMGIVSCGWTPDCSLAKHFCLPLLVIPICPSLFLWSVRLSQGWLDWTDWILGNTDDLCNSKPSLTLIHTYTIFTVCCTHMTTNSFYIEKHTYSLFPIDVKHLFSHRGVDMLAHAQHKDFPKSLLRSYKALAEN